MTTQTARLRTSVEAQKTQQPAGERSIEGHVDSGTFASLHNPDYRLFFGGAMLSNIGTWMQIVAQGWLVVTLTSSEFMVGLVSFCGMLPSLLFSLFGGVLADRRDKRNILIVSQVLSSVLAAMLAVLIHADVVQIWHIMAISMASGTVMALSAPSWQAILPEIVGRRNLLNAIALNSAQFNLTRVIGPSVAGILIKFIGIAGAFYLNAVSYLFFLAAMIVIHPKHSAQYKQTNPEGLFRSLGSALRYVRGHRVIRPVLILAVVQTIFIFPYGTLLPVFAKQVLGLGAGGYSLLLTAAGIGAFLGAIMLAHRGESISKGRQMAFSQVVFALAVAAFAFSSSLIISMIALFFVGWAMVTFLATGNTLVQAVVPDELRGRVMSIWMLAGFGLMPIGSLQAGAVASWTSPTFALAAGSVITLACTVLVVARQRHLLEREGQELSPVTA